MMRPYIYTAVVLDLQTHFASPRQRNEIHCVNRGCASTRDGWIARSGQAALYETAAVDEQVR